MTDINVISASFMKLWTCLIIVPTICEMMRDSEPGVMQTRVDLVDFDKCCKVSLELQKSVELSGPPIVRRSARLLQSKNNVCWPTNDAFSPLYPRHRRRSH